MATNDSANDTTATSARTTRYGRCEEVASAPGAPAHTPDQPRRAEDQRRPHEVELLLDAQRPVVQERRRRHMAGEVVDASQDEPVVADVQRAGDAVADGGPGLQRR